MRTLLQSVAHGLRGQFGLNIHPYYVVEGSFSFVFDSISLEPNLEEIRQSIIEMDAQFPWKDFDFTGQEARSISYLSEGSIRASPRGVAEKQEMYCWFRIFPGIDHIDKGQIHAYRNYLGKIASELAMKKLPHVKFVRFEMKICTEQEFEVE